MVLRHYVISKHITSEFVINYHFRMKNTYTPILRCGFPLFFVLIISHASASKVISYDNGKQFASFAIQTSRSRKECAQNFPNKIETINWKALMHTQHKLMFAENSISKSCSLCFLKGQKLDLFFICFFLLFMRNKVDIFFFKREHFSKRTFFDYPPTRNPFKVVSLLMNDKDWVEQKCSKGRLLLVWPCLRPLKFDNSWKKLQFITQHCSHCPRARSR